MAGDGGVQWPDQAVLDTWNRVHEVAAWVGGSEALTMAILTPLGAWVDGQPVAAQPARIRDLAAISPVIAVTTFRHDRDGAAGGGSAGGPHAAHHPHGARAGHLDLAGLPAPGRRRSERR